MISKLNISEINLLVVVIRHYFDQEREAGDQILNVQKLECLY
jgi:hypothetical protein